MKTYKITARQIKIFEETTIDKQALDAMLKSFMNHYTNRLNEITKTEKEVWKELSEIHGIDTQRKKYGLAVVDGCAQIQEIKD